MSNPSPDPFVTPFFLGHTERSTVTIDDHRGHPRAYTFPTFFTHTPSVTMLFTADLAAARALLPAGPLSPVKLNRTRCLVALAAYRYGQISDGMVGYSELALGIAVSRSRVPIAPALLRQAWSSFGVFVVDLPVDSAENCRRGQAIWGLPKTMKQFRYADSEGTRTVEVYDGEEMCMGFTWARGGKRALIAERHRAYSMRDGKLLVSRAFLDGACWQYNRLSSLSAKARVTFGTGEPYARFAALKLGARPLLVRDFECLSTALYAPEPAAL